MGVFSEMAMDAQEQEPDVVAPFTLEQSEQEPMDSFADEEKQQAEAAAAPAALAYLNKQEEPSCDDDCDEDEEGSENSQEDGKAEDKTATPAQKKKEHEEQEAKRKAEWEAAKAAKEEADLMAWETAVAVSDDELVKRSLQRVGTESERLTRRNMKICVTEHIQTKCLEDMDFARQTMNPQKKMLHCFRYINRMALDFIKKEMADNDEKPDYNGFGGDVPDELCYKWAEDYFYDLDAEEDKDKNDKFVPKPYTGPSVPKQKKAETKKQEKKPAAKAEVSPPQAEGEQIALGGQLSLLEVSA